GVRIIADGARFYALLQVQNKDCEGGCWMQVQIHDGTAKDERNAAVLRDMADKKTPVLKGTVVFVPTKGRAYLRLCFNKKIIIPEIGKRVATLGPVHKRDKRFLLRTEFETIDYTQKLHTLLQ